ncbi:2-hydroxyacyl-CoA dehydratase subunit D [Chloroflexota bacterium]
MVDVKAVLSELRGIAENPYQWLSEWKSKNDKKVIGCLGLYAPEELIHAAGCHPMVVREVADEPITKADRVFQSFFCGFSREVMDIALKGKLDCLDGLAVVDICTTFRGLIETIPKHAPNIGWFHPLHFPIPLQGTRTWEWTIQELDGFKTSLEEFTNQPITESELRKSIGLYNRFRSLLDDLYHLKRAQPWSISAADLQAVVISGMVRPKEEHCEVLELLLSELRNQPDPHQEHVRVLAAGMLCRSPGLPVMAFIENCGALVVDDDFYTGSRYFMRHVGMDGDALEALAQAHMRMTAPCPTKYDPDNDFGDYLITKFERSRAHGVITISLQNCEMYAINYPRMWEKLRAHNIPTLVIEIEPGMLETLLRTRVEAFVEVLKQEI